MGSGKAWERRAVWKGSVCLKPTRPSFISPPSFPSASSDWRLPYKARAHLIAMDFFTARSILSHQTPLTKGPQTRGAAVVLPSLPPSLPPSLSPWRLVRVQRQRETRTPPPLRRQPRAQLPAPLCVSGGSSGDHSTEAEPAAGSSRRHHTGADPPPRPDPQSDSHSPVRTLGRRRREAATATGNFSATVSKRRRRQPGSRGRLPPRRIGARRAGWPRVRLASPPYSCCPISG